MCYSDGIGPVAKLGAAHAEFDAGVAAVQVGDIARALDHFNRACALEPSAAKNQLYRAWARYHLVSAEPPSVREDVEAVRASCRITIMFALEQQPRFDAGYVLLGTILIGEGRLDRARECFLKALAINPDNVGAQMGLDNTQPA